MPTEMEIDDEIIAYLAATNGHWRKVAMVIVRVTERLGLPDGPAGYDLVCKRIPVLVGNGKLVAQGDISLWRNSELRLPS